jgi:hypothetical protein
MATLEEVSAMHDIFMGYPQLWRPQQNSIPITPCHSPHFLHSISVQALDPGHMEMDDVATRLVAMLWLIGEENNDRRCEGSRNGLLQVDDETPGEGWMRTSRLQPQMKTSPKWH